MTKTTFMALLFGLMATTSGCADQYMSLTFDLTYDGKTCTEAGVVTTEITVWQQASDSVGGSAVATKTIACPEASATLDAKFDLLFSRGYTVMAYDAAGQTIYRLDGKLDEEGGDRTLPLTLKPVSVLIFTWDFDGKTCEAVDVRMIYVTVDDRWSGGSECPSDTTPIAASQTNPIEPGDHAYRVEGRDYLEHLLYLATGSLTTVVGQNDYHIVLMPVASE